MRHVVALLLVVAGAACFPDPFPSQQPSPDLDGVRQQGLICASGNGAVLRIGATRTTVVEARIQGPDCAVERFSCSAGPGKLVWQCSLPDVAPSDERRYSVVDRSDGLVFLITTLDAAIAIHCKSPARDPALEPLSADVERDCVPADAGK